MQSGIAQQRQIKGWGFSLILHGLLLSTILPVFHHLPTPIHPEPFRWNVTLAESPQHTTEVASANDSSAMREFSQTVQTGEQRLARSTSDLSPPAQQLKNEINETLQESDDAKPVMPTQPPTAFTQAQPEMTPPASSTTEQVPFNQESLPLRQNTIERPGTVATAPIPTESSARPVEPLEQELRTTLAPSFVADAVLAPTQPRDPLPVPPVTAPTATSGQSSASHADYSWLQRAVSRRLEELKRSSRPSLEDSSRLKVLVRAVVSDRGELMEAEVVKSSGLEQIDREAMTLVHRAFPMQLDHTLDRQQIVMRIPITYSRD